MAKRRKAAGSYPVACAWVLPIKLILFILKMIAIACYWYMRLILFIVLLIPMLIYKLIAGNR